MDYRVSPSPRHALAHGLIAIPGAMAPGIAIKPEGTSRETGIPDSEAGQNPQQAQQTTSGQSDTPPNHLISERSPGDSEGAIACAFAGWR